MIIPSITIILPVYNGGNYLIESVNSVLQQSLSNFELLIIDDCSNDGSWEYLNNINDDRIQLFRNATNKGLFYNLNFLIEKSNSDLIKLWSQDDIMNPNCLRSIVDFHNTNKNLGFSYSQREMMNEFGQIKQVVNNDNTPEIISKDLHARIAYYTGSVAGNIANVCINKIALSKVGLFNESMKISADFDMWVRMAEYFEIGHINSRLIKLRDHTGQLSRQEKLFANHVEEDAQVYKYLNGYIDYKLKHDSRYYFVHYKLLYYYTLMIKSILKGAFTSAYRIGKAISGFENLFFMTVIFFKVKLLAIKPKPFSIR